MQSMNTFASLFTGGGLADIGAMQAGYELLWGVEYDPAIAAVANANLKHCDQVYAASVVGFDWDAVERPDHLHMSPPCQDFSVAKTSGKVSNDNDTLADACIEALRTLQPSTVTIENVEAYRKAEGFQRIVDALWGMGYWVNSEVLNSADFGVPQTRRRLILRAVHGGFPAPLPPPVRPWKGWYEAIEDLIPALPETEFAPWQLKRLPRELKTGMFGPSLDPESQDSTRSRDVDEPHFTVRASGSSIHNYKALLVESKNANQQYGDGIQDAVEPHTTVVTDYKPSHQPKVLLVNSAFPGSNGKKHYTTDEPSFTIDTTALGRMKASTPSSRVVRMTPRALARFQTVPDWYQLPEKNQLACKIIGNGVPCLMMQRIMEGFECLS